MDFFAGDGAEMQLALRLESFVAKLAGPLLLRTEIEGVTFGGAGNRARMRLARQVDIGQIDRSLVATLTLVDSMGPGDAATIAAAIATSIAAQPNALPSFELVQGEDVWVFELLEVEAILVGPTTATSTTTTSSATTTTATEVTTTVSTTTATTATHTSTTITPKPILKGSTLIAFVGMQAEIGFVAPGSNSDRPPLSLVDLVGFVKVALEALSNLARTARIEGAWVEAGALIVQVGADVTDLARLKSRIELELLVATVTPSGNRYLATLATGATRTTKAPKTTSTKTTKTTTTTTKTTVTSATATTETTTTTATTVTTATKTSTTRSTTTKTTTTKTTTTKFTTTKTKTTRTKTTISRTTTTKTALETEPPIVGVPTTKKGDESVWTIVIPIIVGVLIMVALVSTFFVFKCWSDPAKEAYVMETNANHLAQSGKYGYPGYMLEESQVVDPAPSWQGGDSYDHGGQVNPTLYAHGTTYASSRPASRAGSPRSRPPSAFDEQSNMEQTPVNTTQPPHRSYGRFQSNDLTPRRAAAQAHYARDDDVVRTLGMLSGDDYNAAMQTLALHANVDAAVDLALRRAESAPVNFNAAVGALEQYGSPRPNPTDLKRRLQQRRSELPIAHAPMSSFGPTPEEEEEFEGALGIGLPSPAAQSQSTQRQHRRRQRQPEQQRPARPATVYDTPLAPQEGTAGRNRYARAHPDDDNESLDGDMHGNLAPRHQSSSAYNMGDNDGWAAEGGDEDGSGQYGGATNQFDHPTAAEEQDWADMRAARPSTVEEVDAMYAE
jgi:hypothetical protein